MGCLFCCEVDVAPNGCSNNVAVGMPKLSGRWWLIDSNNFAARFQRRTFNSSKQYNPAGKMGKLPKMKQRGSHSLATHWNKANVNQASQSTQEPRDEEHLQPFESIHHQRLPLPKNPNSPNRTSSLLIMREYPRNENRSSSVEHKSNANGRVLSALMLSRILLTRNWRRVWVG